MNKRITSFFLCIVMLVTMIISPMPTYAEEQVPTLSITPNQSEFYHGETVEYTVSLYGVENAMTFEFVLVIPNELEYVTGSFKIPESLGKDHGIDSLGELVTFTEEHMQYMFVLDYGEYTSFNDEVLMTFECNVKDTASFGVKAISWSDSFFYDNQGEEYSVNYTSSDSEIQVKPTPIPATGVTLQKDDADIPDDKFSLVSGTSAILTAIPEPDNVTDTPVWSVYPETDAAVTLSGSGTSVTVTGAKVGTATVTVKLNDNVQASCEITVTCAHANKTEVSAVAPTCVATGNNLYYDCDDCDVYFKADKTTVTTVEAEILPINSANHSTNRTYVEAVTDANCQNFNFDEYWICECGDTLDKDGNEIEVVRTNGNHSLMPISAVTPTCVATGNNLYYDCEYCDVYFKADKITVTTVEAETLPIDDDNHTWSTDSDTPPYHTDEANHYRYCVLCGDNDTENGKAHSGGIANCKEHAVCETCGAFYGELDDNNHLTPNEYSYDDNLDGTHKKSYECCDKLVVEKEPHTEGGTCACGYDPSHTHSGTTIDAKPADCEMGINGNIAYFICEKCGKWFDASNNNLIENPDDVILPGTHNITQHDAVAATCKTEGTIEYWSCSNCGFNYDSAEGTNKVDNIVEAKNPDNHVTPDTYKYLSDEDGHTHVYSCCEAVYEEKAAHTYNADWKCTVCNYQHAHGNGTLVQGFAANCGAGKPGQKDYYVCSCGEWFYEQACTTKIADKENDIIIPAEHDLTPVEAVLATCCKPGNVAYWHCENCTNNYADAQASGDPLATVVSPATGAHTDDNSAWEQSATKHWHTCTVGGTKFDEADHIPGEDFICDTCGYILKIAENGTYTKIEKTELTKVPATLAEKYETVEALEAELTRILVTNSTFTENNVQTFDVKLQYRNSATGEWNDATEANFPVEGITVELPYPEGTNGDTHDFKVTHMFTVTSAKLGTTAGNTETLEGKQIVETKDGIRVTLKGLSPVAVAWKATPKNDDSDDYRFWYYTVYQLMSQKFNVVATAGEGGTITDMGMSTVNYDMSKTYVITPDEGYEIDTVYVNGKDIGAVDQYTFRSIKRNQTISVTFRKLVWDNPFTDIAETDSYYNAIEFVYENGLFKGTSQTAFSPDTTMTRAMFVTVLGRLAGVEEKLYTDVSFNDVVAGEYYAPYVEWANDNGIVQGYGDGTFGINDEITVEQAAVIIARYAAFVGVNTASNFDLSIYADVADVSDWAYGAMQWAVENGIYVPETALVPKNDASRALVATMFYNFVTEYID